mmetsp:Transcript_7913/g.20512  ORF Transcript_7913/g.20512 Transcript_7913/m.20512 type:complete len:233 (+) Transcript_7913:119-817(+)
MPSCISSRPAPTRCAATSRSVRGGSCPSATPHSCIAPSSSCSKWARAAASGSASTAASSASTEPPHVADAPALAATSANLSQRAREKYSARCALAALNASQRARQFAAPVAAASLAHAVRAALAVAMRLISTIVIASGTHSCTRMSRSHDSSARPLRSRTSAAAPALLPGAATARAESSRRSGAHATVWEAEMVQACLYVPAVSERKAKRNVAVPPGITHWSAAVRKKRGGR